MREESAYTEKVGGKREEERRIGYKKYRENRGGEEEEEADMCGFTVEWRAEQHGIGMAARSLGDFEDFERFLVGTLLRAALSGARERESTDGEAAEGGREGSRRRVVVTARTEH